MEFLCDVHISFKIANHIKSLGYNAIYVNEILNKWNATDAEIYKYADENDLIVISKDTDFRNSFYIQNTPKKLIKINLGNTSNQELIQILSDNIIQIEKLNNEDHFIIEVDRKNILFNLLK